MSQHKYTLNRRQLLKSGAVLGGGALFTPALSPLACAQAMAEGKIIITAAHWGPLAVTMKDGKIIKSEPAIEDLGDNPLQTVVADQVYNKVRITQPMIRKGFLDNLDNITQPDGKRGDDAFIPISWDKAYDIIEKQLRRIYASYGPQSIFAGSYGWRSAGVLHKAYTLMQRFLNLAGGYVGHLGDYSTGAAQVILPHVLGTLEVYEQQTSWEVVLDESKIVVLWGMNLYNSSQIAWSASDGQARLYLKKLKERPDIKVLNIDPTWTETADFLGKDRRLSRQRPLRMDTDQPQQRRAAHARHLPRTHPPELARHRIPEKIHRRL